MPVANDIREAAARIQPIARRTPVLTSHLVDAAMGLRCHFKCENFQRGGAFKIRGAANFLFSIPPADIGRGVVAFSSGNHAQAVAIAAAYKNTAATIVMPHDAPRAKLEATRAYGATVIQYDRLTEDREAIGARIAAEGGATLVPPFDHDWIIAGQGTAALELLEETPELDALVVPLGGGGLLSGTAIIAQAMRAGIRVFGVEPEAGNDYYLSRKAGKRVAIAPPETIADGLRSPMPGALTFPIIERLVEEIILVSDEEILGAMELLRSRMKIVVEPSGAVGAAACLFHKLPEGIRSAGIILSGGNL
ncbi:MAG: pyridoxal-phosphate dependent enzyme [Bryobacteraceae bacterium]